VISKVRNGTLTLDVGGTPFEASCQPTNVRIVPPEQPDAGDAAEVLCGDPLPDEEGEDFGQLAMAVVQDFDVAAGLIAWSWAHKGETVQFTWDPSNAANGLRMTGTVMVWPIEIGGDVGPARQSADVEWQLQSHPVPSWPA
jgi:hypothetical protein